MATENDRSTTDEKREAPEFRKHETYKEDHWRVLDVSDVDRVFAVETTLGALGDGDAGVRIDIDGYAANSGMRDLADAGDNVNTSIFLSIDDAVSLVEQITAAIPQSLEHVHERELRERDE